MAGDEAMAAAAPLDDGGLTQDVRSSMAATQAAGRRVVEVAPAAGEQPGPAQGAGNGGGQCAGQCQGEAAMAGQGRGQGVGGQGQGQGQGSEGERCRALLERLLQGALADGVAAGELPAVSGAG